VLSDFLYVFATKYLAILFWLLNLIADCVLKKNFICYYQSFVFSMYYYVVVRNSIGHYAKENISDQR